MKIRLKDMEETYAFADPAAGKSQLQVTLCKSAIAVVKVDEIGRIFVVKGWAKRCSTDEFVEEIFTTQTDWKPRIFGIEANAMQSLFADMLKREQRGRKNTGKLKERLGFTEVKQSTRVDKDFRIRAALQPLVHEGALLVEESMVELVDQIATFPQCETKDLIDALASCTRLIPPRRSRRGKELEIERKIKYLRETGAPEAYIQQLTGRAA